ncbi:MAG: deoxyribose-phosphate aldolase [Armatimonadota bacterium]|nr:MAG: deoxyribose-phosphate aldolase [Armatimonadota bacterium]
MFSRVALAKMIDHSLLRPEATEEEIVAFCEESRREHFATVMVYPCWLTVAARCLRDSDVKLGTVVGFPFGATTTACKVFEAKHAITTYASELDMVVNIGALKSGNLDSVRRDIEEVVTAAEMTRLTANGEEVLVKVILETGLTTREEQEKVCRIVQEVRAHFVKTSTGFGPRGASVEDIRFLRQAVGRDIGIKAAGGIRTYKQTLEFINAGADRIGTSSGVAILGGYDKVEEPIAEEALGKE